MEILFYIVIALVILYAVYQLGAFNGYSKGWDSHVSLIQKIQDKKNPPVKKTDTPKKVKVKDTTPKKKTTTKKTK